MNLTMKKILLINLIILLIIFSLSSAAFADVKLISSLTQKYNVNAGGQYQGQLTLANTGSESSVVKIYKRDYRFDAQGCSYYPEPGTLERSNSGWIEVNKNQVTIPGKAEKKIDYTIRVPRKENLMGTYWSVLMLEPVNKDINKYLRADIENKIGVEQHFRYGVQIISNIGHTGSCELKFKNPKLKKDKNNYMFLIDFLNQGQRLLSPAVWLELFRNNGEKIDEYDGQKLRIYPETSVRQQIKLSDIKAGKYVAVLIADCGNSAVFGSRYNLEIKE